MTPPAALAERELSSHLQRWARYVAVVAEQLEALGQADFEQLRVLTQERDQLEAELHRALETDHGGSGPSLQGAVEAGLTELAEKTEADRQMKEGWIRLSDSVIRSARSIRPTAASPGRYAVPGIPGERLDRCL